MRTFSVRDQWTMDSFGDLEHHTGVPARVAVSNRRIEQCRIVVIMQRRKRRPYLRPPLPSSRNEDSPPENPAYLVAFPSPGYAPGTSIGNAGITPSPGYAPGASRGNDGVTPSPGYAPGPSPGYAPVPPTTTGFGIMTLATITEYAEDPDSPRTPSDGLTIIVGSLVAPGSAGLGTCSSECSSNIIPGSPEYRRK
ncbi:hypothetical protein R1sor_022459 [Riccia sorocarpa]|uniref:Uncharacterized protein n=1 Tax=Riccia sorocarpa TaxID=122646 RepID=A0ABD3GJY6_9MARC